MKINVTRNLIDRGNFEECRNDYASNFWNPISMALRRALLRKIEIVPEKIRVYFYTETGEISVDVKTTQAMQEFILCFNTRRWEMLFPFSFDLDIEDIEKQAREQIHYKT